jgi:hypothetical protein
MHTWVSELMRRDGVADMLEDPHGEIERLALRFADACCRRDAGAFARLWTVDPGSGVATWEVDPPAGFTRSGTPEELAAGFSSGLAHWDGILQLVHGTIATVDDDGATARVYVTELGQRTGAADGYRNVGVYLDRLVLTEDGWRFVHRRYHYLYIDRAPLEGEFRVFPPVTEL